MNQQPHLPYPNQGEDKDYFQYIERLVEYRNNHSNVSKHMSMKVTDIKPGWAKGEMLCQEFHMNPIGSVHGGMIFILADFVAGTAACTRGKVVTTSNATTYFINPAYMPEKLYAEASEIKTGLTLSVYDVVVTDDKDKIIAKMVIEFYNLRIDFEDYVKTMCDTNKDLYYDDKVFGDDKVPIKKF